MCRDDACGLHRSNHKQQNSKHYRQRRQQRIAPPFLQSTKTFSGPLHKPHIRINWSIALRARHFATIDYCIAKGLSDPLVGGRKKRIRHRQAEDIRGLQIDRLFEFG